MEIDTRQLRYLLAIDRAGSFVKAAELLNISQPALSVAISRLEDVLGQKIVERDRHGTQLNAVGKILVRHARSIEHVLNTAREEVELFDLGSFGPLVVGGTPLATSSIIPDVVARISREMPSVKIDVIEDVDENLIEKLCEYELDVAIGNVGLNAQPDTVREEALFNARAVMVVRPDHELAGRASISIKDLTDAVWVMPPEGGAFRQQLEGMFTTNGLQFPRNLVQAAPFGVLKEIVKQSDGVTILSDQIVRTDLLEGSLVTISLEEQIATRVFGMQTLKTRELNKAAQRFCTIARELAPTFDVAALDSSSRRK